MYVQRVTFNHVCTHVWILKICSIDVHMNSFLCMNVNVLCSMSVFVCPLYLLQCIKVTVFDIRQFILTAFRPTNTQNNAAIMPKTPF